MKNLNISLDVNFILNYPDSESFSITSSCSASDSSYSASGLKNIVYKHYKCSVSKSYIKDFPELSDHFETQSAYKTYLHLNALTELRI